MRASRTQGHGLNKGYRLPIWAPMSNLKRRFWKAVMRFAAAVRWKWLLNKATYQVLLIP